MDAPPEQAPDRAFDEYLVALSQAGSADALDGLVRRWTPRLLRYAARMLGGSGATEAARDVVQETWLGVVRGLRGLRDPAQFPAWIYGIATRKCADAIRRRVRRRQVDLAAGRNAGERAPADEAGAERRLDLDSAIRALPDEQRAVIHLFYREDLTVEEVAAALAIPPGTVKSRLHYAREALKRHLEERT
jgi:RNA polymerase sigma-70 factor (ECF subfamily)